MNAYRPLASSPERRCAENTTSIEPRLQELADYGVTTEFTDHKYSIVLTAISQEAEAYFRFLKRLISAPCSLHLEIASESLEIWQACYDWRRTLVSPLNSDARIGLAYTETASLEWSAEVSIPQGYYRDGWRTSVRFLLNLR